jgi:hypothetical protein
MRTTLNLEENAYILIKDYAKKREISLSRAASELISLGSKNLPKWRSKGGWFVFDLPPGSPPLTSELVKEFQRMDEEEEVRRAISPAQ